MLFVQCEEITIMKSYNYARSATSEELCICYVKGEAEDDDRRIESTKE